MDGYAQRFGASAATATLPADAATFAEPLRANAETRSRTIAIREKDRGAWTRHAGAETRRHLDLVYSYFPRLTHRREVAAGYISGGEQLLAERHATLALKYAQTGYVMESGRSLLDGDAKTMADNEDIEEFYLGLSGVGQRKSCRDVQHYRRRKRWLS